MLIDLLRPRITPPARLISRPGFPSPGYAHCMLRLPAVTDHDQRFVVPWPVHVLAIDARNADIGTAD